jgi:AraC-like DNA-binding protein/mannose-6-phosphate isomerase-like protein (cupin superfamily)
VTAQRKNKSSRGKSGRNLPHPAAPGGEVLFERSAFRVEKAFRFVQTTRPVFTQFLLNRVAQSFVFSLHQHAEFEILLIIRGPYRCRVNGRQLDLKTNSVLVVQPGDWHEDQCEPPLKYVGLNFHLQGSAGEGGEIRFFRAGIPAEKQHTSLKSAEYLPLLEKIALEADQHDAVSVQIQDAVMEELFWRLARAFPASSLAEWLLPQAAEKDFLVRLRRCFAQNIHHSASVESMAAELGIGERTLGLRCAELLHTSPAKAFLRFKIERARHLLRRTEMPVKAIGYHLGFSSPYHFSRAYKQIYHHAPTRERA